LTYNGLHGIISQKRELFDRGLISPFVFRYWGKSKKSSRRLATLRAEILTCWIRNMENQSTAKIIWFPWS
jgi:hypothetical protein